MWVIPARALRVAGRPKAGESVSSMLSLYTVCVAVLSCCVYSCMYVCLCVCIDIYMQRERERDRKKSERKSARARARESERLSERDIYIYIYRESE
jgi:hypothetical protein